MLVLAIVLSLAIGLYIGWRVFVWWWGRQKRGNDNDKMVLD